MADKVLATITTYNPELDLLEKNIDAIVNQVDKVLVYENASSNREEIVALCQNKDVELILNDKNYGVAGPLRDGLDYAFDNGYAYILTLDQDSVASEGMIESLVSLIKTDDKLALVSAQPVTVINGVEFKDDSENHYVDDVITSGTLADVAKLKEIGGYMPEMFIDWVDTEICFRVITNGYKIMQSTAPLKHTIGEPERRRFLWKWVVVTNYSPFRCYYIGRNSTCFTKVYKKRLYIKRGYLFRRKMKILLYESNKLEKIKALSKGKKDAKAFYKQIIEKYQFLTQK